MKRLYHIILVALCCLIVRTAYAGSNMGKPYLRTYSSLEYHGHNRNFDVECDSTGCVYIANFEGLLMYDGVEWRMVHTQAISRVTRLFKSHNGTIWFGGYNTFGYVSHKDSAKVKFLANDERDSFGEVKEIYEQKGRVHFSTDERRSYVVTDGGRIVREKTRKFENVSVTHSYISGVNARLKLGHNGLTVLATASSGIIIRGADGNTVNTLTTDDGLCSNNVTAIADDGYGCVWGVTDNGVFAFNTTQIYTHFDQHQGLEGQVTSILPCDRELYVGTLQGIFHLGGDGRFRRITDDTQACWQLIRLSDGSIMAATALGVLLYQNGKVTRLTSKHALSVYEGEGSTFVAGEVDGISRYSTAGQLVAELADLPNVCQIQGDGKGGIWALALSGKTYHMKYGDNAFREKKNPNMSLLLHYVDDKGTLWEPNSNGIGVTSAEAPDYFRKWLQPFNDLIVTNMAVSDGVMWLGGYFGLIRFDIEGCGNAHLEPNRTYIRNLTVNGRNITLKMSSGKYDPIGTTYYSYRLHANSDWTEWDTDMDIDLPNQMYGPYRIQVRSKDAFGQVSESEEVSMRIPAPFYLRWYSLLFYLFTIIMLVYLAMWWRLKRMKEEQLRLEAIVEERTGELRSAQKLLIRQEREATVGKLTKGLIDRILNPMNYINNFSHLTLGLVKDLKQNLNDLNDEIEDCKADGAVKEDSADEIADLVDDSADVLSMMQTNLDKIEQHGLSTTRTLKAMEAMLKEQAGTPQPTDICALLHQNREMLLNYHREAIERLGIEVEWNVPGTSLVLPLVADSISKTVMSLIGNSVYAIERKSEKGKYGDAKPCISLTLTRVNDGVEIALRDNGIGIEENIIDKVFDPFFTTKPTSEAPGVGLYLAHQAIQNHGGTITVTSQKYEYTEFKIWIPSKN